MKLTSALKRLSLCLASLALAGNALGGTDNFANSTTIQSTRYYSDEVSILTFTKQSGEPEIGNGGMAGRTAWWNWTAPEDGLCTVNTLYRPEAQPLLDSVIGVFTGLGFNELTEVAWNDDHSGSANGASTTSASCTFYATQGTTYHIVVDGYSPSKVTADSHRLFLNLGFVPKRAMHKLAAGYSYNQPELHHSVSFNKTSSYSFSARVKVGRVSYPVRGLLSPEGYFMSALPRRGPANGPPLPPYGLLLDAKDGQGVTLWAGNNDGSMATLYEVRRYQAGNPCPLAGRFANGGALVMQMNVSAKGGVTGAGRGPDGSAFTFAGPLCARFDQIASANAGLPVTTSLHRGKGYLYQELFFKENGPDDLLLSSALFVRPADSSSVFYPAGLKADVSISPSVRPYIRPAAGNRALGFRNGTNGSGQLNINAVMGELAVKVEEALNFGTNNRFTFASNANKPVLKLNTRTGLVTGSVLDANGQKRSLFGALYPDSNGIPRLTGWAKGTTRNVPFSVN